MRFKSDLWKPRRQRYVKPRLRSFPLAANEVLAKDCRMAGPSIEFEGTGRLSGGGSSKGS